MVESWLESWGQKKALWADGPGGVRLVPRVLPLIILQFQHVDPSSEQGQPSGTCRDPPWTQALYQKLFSR